MKRHTPKPQQEIGWVSHSLTLTMLNTLGTFIFLKHWHLTDFYSSFLRKSLNSNSNNDIRKTKDNFVSVQEGRQWDSDTVSFTMSLLCYALLFSFVCNWVYQNSSLIRGRGIFAVLSQHKIKIQISLQHTVFDTTLFWGNTVVEARDCGHIGSLLTELWHLWEMSMQTGGMQCKDLKSLCYPCTKCPCLVLGWWCGNDRMYTDTARVLLHNTGLFLLKECFIRCPQSFVCIQCLWQVMFAICFKLKYGFRNVL